VSDTNVFPEHMPDIPLDDLPVPLVPGGFWDPEDEHPQIIEPIEPDYESMVRSALMASLAVLASKVIWIVITANALGILVGIDLWAGLVPYLTLDTNQINNDFATIVTVSTIGMGFTAVVLMAWPLIRPTWTRLEIMGRAVALAIVLETWILEAIRQVVADPGEIIVRWDLAWITLVEVAAGGALLFLSLKQPRRVADTTLRRTEAPPDNMQLILEDTQ
jgi:hypothetical protein